MYIMHHSGLLVASREYSSESYYAHRIGVLLLEDESLSISGLARFILNIIRFCRFGLFTNHVPSAFTSSHNPFFIYKDISTSVGFSVFISILFLPTAFKYEEDQSRGNDVVSSRLQGLILYGSSSSWNVG